MIVYFLEKLKIMKSFLTPLFCFKNTFSISDTATFSSDWRKENHRNIITNTPETCPRQNKLKSLSTFTETNGLLWIKSILSIFPAVEIHSSNIKQLQHQQSYSSNGNLNQFGCLSSFYAFFDFSSWLLTALTSAGFSSHGPLLLVYRWQISLQILQKNSCSLIFRVFSTTEHTRIIAGLLNWTTAWQFSNHTKI